MPLLFALLFAHAAASGWQYPKECCSDRDCKPISCTLLEEQSNGSLLDTTTQMSYPPQTIKPSQDGQCHVCANGRPLCVFVLHKETT